MDTTNDTYVPQSEAGKRLLAYSILGAHVQKMREFRAHINSRNTTDKRGNQFYTLEAERIAELQPRLAEFKSILASENVDHFDIGLIRSYCLFKYGTPIKPLEFLNDPITLVTFADKQGNISDASTQEIRVNGLRLPVSERLMNIMIERHEKGEI